MRGKHKKDLTFARPYGITPADAGKTLYVFGLNDVGEDHPRGCGENLTNSDLQPNMLGSPPRMRGKH